MVLLVAVVVVVLLLMVLVVDLYSASVKAYHRHHT
jgi:hypothetical protein